MILTVAMAILSSTAMAQQNVLTKSAVSKLVNDKGYWVIESNIKTPKTSVVHFYTIDDTLMYSEKVEGIKLDIKKRKTVTLLNQALLQTLLVWHKEKIQKQNEQLVKNILHSPK